MYRIDNSTATTVAPTPKPVGQAGFFTAGTVGGQAATIVEADWLNLVQEELIAVLQAAGLPPSKTSNNQVITAILQLIANNTRQRLTGPLDLYVSNSGSDTNNGLTPGTAFATPQRAWDYIMTRLDIGKQTVTVNLAPGNYTGFTCDGVPVGAESQQVVFQGTGGDPTQVLVANNQAGGAAVASVGGARVYIQNFTVQAQNIAVYAARNGMIYVSGIVFNASGAAHMCADEHSVIEVVGAYTIAGGAQSHMWAVKGSQIGYGHLSGAFTVTLLGSPTFSIAFAWATMSAVLDAEYSATFNGAAHGARFLVDNAGIMVVANKNLNYFPGDVAGTVQATTFGIYTDLYTGAPLAA